MEARALSIIGLGGAGWELSNAVLPKREFYEPIWELDAETLGKDLSAHLRDGAGIPSAAARRTLTRGELLL